MDALAAEHGPGTRSFNEPACEHLADLAARYRDRDRTGRPYWSIEWWRTLWMARVVALGRMSPGERFKPHGRPLRADRRLVCRWPGVPL